MQSGILARGIRSPHGFHLGFKFVNINMQIHCIDHKLEVTLVSTASCITALLTWTLCLQSRLSYTNMTASRTSLDKICIPCMKEKDIKKEIKHARRSWLYFTLHLSSNIFMKLCFPFLSGYWQHACWLRLSGCHQHKCCLRLT